MFTHRSYQKELLDEPDIPAPDLYRNLRELHTINTLLGGYSVLFAGLKHFFSGTKAGKFTLLDIGSGGGDSLKVIYKRWADWLSGLTGVDIKADCIDYARQNCADMPLEFVESDYRDFLNKADARSFDLIITSLFCHHLEDKDIVGMLKWMKTHAQTGAIINDLHRHPLAYYSIKLLTWLFSRSYLVKNDAPLSVRRSFRRKEWKQYLQEAGITNYRIKWIWAFRWLIIIDNRPTGP